MPKISSSSTSSQDPASTGKLQRAPRADARRNREHILNVAHQAFAEQGGQVTLDDIVRLSGLGVGTLYRHFPTRDALVEAVYRAEIEKLVEAAREMNASLPPIEALRQWMWLFVEMLATKNALSEALGSMVGGTAELYVASRESLRTAIEALCARAVASGEIVLQVEPLDLLRAVTGVANASPGPQWQESARRLVDVLLAGLRSSVAGPVPAKSDADTPDQN